MNYLLFSRFFLIRNLCVIVFFFANPVLLKADTYYNFLGQNLLGLESVCKIAFFFDNQFSAGSSMDGSLTYMVTNPSNIYDFIKLDTQEFLLSSNVVGVKEIKSVKSLQKRLGRASPRKFFMIVDEAVTGDASQELDDNGQFKKTIFHFDNGEFYCEQVRGAGVLFD